MTILTRASDFFPSFLLALPLVLLAGVGTSLGGPPDEADGNTPVRNVWFEDIREPLHLRATSIPSVCHGAFRAVRKGRVNDSWLATLPYEGGSRAVLLSGFNGTDRAAVSLGAERNFPDAMAHAVRAAGAAGLPADDLQWLKIDIVQNVLPVAGFIARDTPLPTPSLVGIAFGPGSGFAFLPEQLVAGDMTDSKRRLTIHFIGQRLAKQKKWDEVGRWTAIASHKGGQRVCFFETLSFLTDGTRILPLFRGHQLYTSVTREPLLAALKEGGDFLANACREDSPVRVKLPEWRAGVDQDISPETFAAAAIAMIRLSKITDDARYMQTAARYIEHIVESAKSFGDSRKVACIVEPARQEDALNKGMLGETIYLGTQAMTIAALLEFVAAMPADTDVAFRGLIAPLARYLVQQIQPGGDLVRACSYPQGRIVPEIGVTDSALAGRALVMLYEYTSESSFLARAAIVMDSLREKYLDEKPMEVLPRDAWLLEAIDLFFTYNHGRIWIQHAQRIAMAAAADQIRNSELAEKNPRRRIPVLQGSLLPDLFGSVTGYPSMTAAARRTRALVITAKLLRDTRNTPGSLTMLAEAQPGVLFQLQAVMDPASRMYLHKPEAYRGLFRDHLRDFGFSFENQVEHILSLVELVREMREHDIEVLPSDNLTMEALKATRRRLSQFPRALTEALLPGGVLPASPTVSPTDSSRPAAGGPPMLPVRPIPKR